MGDAGSWSSTGRGFYSIFLPKISGISSIPLLGETQTPCPGVPRKETRIFICGMLIHGKSQTNPGILGIKFQQASLTPPKPCGFGKAGKEQEFQAPPSHFIPFFKNILEVRCGNIQEFGLKMGIPWNLKEIESLSPIPRWNPFPWQEVCFSLDLFCRIFPTCPNTTFPWLFSTTDHFPQVGD